ncbi:TetR/AcrR family transcriptional regulator [Pacificoceanicola onchidii]|uniref:TetR/AcrR family transcriptional regulator n=1 Tax=Pacificoceanicola onchidii TaxID=2562685 RepID=UPI0014560CCE|nr:TetR/AcrR family transcriptional regulator [Pacificoceanicola onchidii]
MARPREFNYDDALRGAMEIFWQRGYRGTTLPDLLAAMGMTRGSFYQAFGDKEATYLAALDYYDTAVVSTVVDRLGRCAAPSAVACLLPMFQSSEADTRGCFICNAMVEMGPEHPEAAQKTRAMADRLRRAILSVLEHFASPSPDRTLPETADLILHLYFGKQAMGKAGGAAADWEGRLRSLV